MPYLSVGYTFSYDKYCKKTVRQFSYSSSFNISILCDKSTGYSLCTQSLQNHVLKLISSCFWQKATAIIVGWSKGHMCNNHSMHYTESLKLCNFYSIRVICACPAGCTPLLYCKDVHKYDPSGQFIAETLPLSWTTGLKVLQMC